MDVSGQLAAGQQVRHGVGAATCRSADACTASDPKSARKGAMGGKSCMVLLLRAGLALATAATLTGVSTRASG